MQKNTKKTIEYFLENTEKETIGSYAQLVKLLSGTELEDTEALLKELENFSFIEDESTLYNKLPMAVYYKQLPAVIDSDVLVKVVLLQQADGLALVVPENVVEAYQDLIKDATLIVEKNNNISLYAEIYNFDSTDKNLQDLIKSVYISCGNELKPFDLKNDLAQKQKETSEENNEPGQDDAPLFEPIVDSLPEMEEIQVNEEAYKKFKKQSNVIEKFLEHMYEKSNNILKKNVKVLFFKKVLIIEVNNKNVYQTYEKSPVVAKKLLSNFGEAIRKNKNTQLLDSFSKNGKRYFVVAENIANNYWYVANEEIEKLNDQAVYIEPISKNVIKLNSSSVRKESRKLVPFKKGKKIVFVGRLI
jgi:tetrahydromethanopterin S-methyltransferase subunit A